MKKAKLYGKLGKLILASARQGGADPAANPKLGAALAAAKAAALPREIVDRNLRKAGEKAGAGGADFSEVLYEAYGPGGRTGFIVEALTDNVNRTAAEVKAAVKAGGGKVADGGSVRFGFERAGVVVLDAGGEGGSSKALDEDTVRWRAREEGGGGMSRRRRNEQEEERRGSMEKKQRPHPLLLKRPHLSLSKHTLLSRSSKQPPRPEPTTRPPPAAAAGASSPRWTSSAPSATPWPPPASPSPPTPRASSGSRRRPWSCRPVGGTSRRTRGCTRSCWSSRTWTRCSAAVPGSGRTTTRTRSRGAGERGGGGGRGEERGVLKLEWEIGKKRTHCCILLYTHVNS